MQKFLITTFFSIAFFTAGAQWYLQPLPLHKKDFKAIATNRYTMAFEYEEAEGEKRLKRVVEFNTQGLPVMLYEKGTNDNGDSVNTLETVYQFDGKGRLVREKNTDYSEGAEWTTVYTYTTNNRLSKKQTISIDPATTTFTYNSAGKLTKTLTTIRMAALDKNGEPTSKRIDKPQQKATYVYDKKGLLKEQWIYDLSYPENEKKWTYKLVWTFNEKNQLIGLQRVNNEGLTYSSESYEYNTEGLLIKAISKMDGEPEKTFTYEYCDTCKQSWTL